MAAHNPPRPGQFIAAVYLEPNGLRGREPAAKLGVTPSTLNRVLTGASGVSPHHAGDRRAASSQALLRLTTL